jgi:hypothetical protein
MPFPRSQRAFWAAFGFKDGRLVLRGKGHHRHTVLKESLARAGRDEAVATFNLDLGGEEAVRSAVVRWLRRLGVEEDAAEVAVAALGDWPGALRPGPS